MHRLDSKSFTARQTFYFQKLFGISLFGLPMAWKKVQIVNGFGYATKYAILVPRSMSMDARC